MSLTDLVEHLVAFIEDEAVNVAEAQLLVAHKGIETSRSGDDDVRMGVLVLEEFDVLLHWGTSVKDSGFDFGHVLAEASVFVLDLIRKLASVTHDEN